MPKNKRIQRDHARQHQQSAPENAVIAAQLEQLLTPLIFEQQQYYRQLGLRNRILTLPLMVALVLTLIWRKVPGARELTRMLAREDLLWCKATKVTQQALSERLLCFPAQLFERLLMQLLPQLHQRWQQRQRRPLPMSIAFAQKRFERIWVVDGSTLEALFRKLDSLQEQPIGTLAGRMATVVDLVTRLPVEVWFNANPKSPERCFQANLLQILNAKTLLIMDRGFYHFEFWSQLIERNVDFICRLQAKASYQVEQVLSDLPHLKDQQILLGVKRKSAPQVKVRLIQVRVGATWHSYLTSVLDPHQLPPFVVADLYRRRWRIEEAFLVVKRLLGLSYLWTGSINGVKLQLWATWLFYAVLVDLGDAVADEVGVPFDQISLEMLYRGLYHFSTALHRGTASDPVLYFADPNNRDLGVVKPRKSQAPPDLSPFPTKLLTFALAP
jgi:hypothetical protein